MNTLIAWLVGIVILLFPATGTGVRGGSPGVPTGGQGPAGASASHVADALGSVVKIEADARATCGAAMEGSGWVVAPERVVTNAHVVAGSVSVSIQVGGVGSPLTASVVGIDTVDDLAVLAVPGLTAAPLALADDEPAAGAVELIAGFPLDGPLTTGAATVTGQATEPASDVYGRRLRGTEVSTTVDAPSIDHGSSGGPMLTSDGRVAGVVFAKSTIDGTGYVIPLRVVRRVASVAADASAPVRTGACVA